MFSVFFYRYTVYRFAHLFQFFGKGVCSTFVQLFWSNCFFNLPKKGRVQLVGRVRSENKKAQHSPT